MSNAKSWLVKYWQIFVAVALVIFNVGYTIAKLEEKPSKGDVTESIRVALSGYDKIIRDNYIEIKKVPGLQETLNAINEKLNALNDRFDKWEERIFYKK